MSLTFGNGSEIPLIGFGTNAGVPKGEGEEYLEKIIDAALETGYRHFDTALIYRNEKIIGNVLQKWFKSGKLKREDVFITTKLSIPFIHPDRVEAAITLSLKNLQLEYIDLYLIHFTVGSKYHKDTTFLRDENGDVVMEGKTDHEGLWKKLEEHVDLKRTRYIGLSNYNIPQIETVLNSARIKPTCLQIEVHAYLQQHDLVDFCHKNDITVVGFSPLGARDYNTRMKTYIADFKAEKLPDVLNDDVIYGVAQKYSKSVAQVTLRFLIQRGVIPIPKSTNFQRIKENFDVFDFELDENEMVMLRNLDIGEDARITTFKKVMKGVENHPNYPYGK